MCGGVACKRRQEATVSERRNAIMSCMPHGALLGRNRMATTRCGGTPATPQTDDGETIG